MSARMDLIRILRSLPALETLLIHAQHIAIPLVDFFKAFIPMDAQAVSRLNQSSGEDQIFEVLCPRLDTLEIKDSEHGREPAAELIPVLESVVTSRAVAGSPLKSFAFHMFDEYLDANLKWELIGREGSFIMKTVLPTNPFLLQV